jgi:hypothetical protein
MFTGEDGDRPRDGDILKCSKLFEIVKQNDLREIAPLQDIWQSQFRVMHGKANIGLNHSKLKLTDFKILRK